MSEIRCWQCGAEPLELIDVSALGNSEPQYPPGQWSSATDHQHSHIEPTPGQLLADGARAFDRVIGEWSS